MSNIRTSQQRVEDALGVIAARQEEILDEVRRTRERFDLVALAAGLTVPDVLPMKYTPDEFEEAHTP
jgi:hypothetical protein